MRLQRKLSSCLDLWRSWVVLMGLMTSFGSLMPSMNCILIHLWGLIIGVVVSRGLGGVIGYRKRRKVHADPTTLRNGLSFIIDMSGKDDKQAKVGNEKTVQAFYQAIPQRPQIILIAGSSFIMRTIINKSIKLASLFIKQKVLGRIHFVSVDDALSRVPLKSAPVYCGGEGGGVKCYKEWVKERLGQLTKPDLSEGPEQSADNLADSLAQTKIE
mmetsp:Transcript_44945/g.137259  ORF Transcript_44945/g.137259 Transcript_44945/m.137259 type:complete len:214 (+) Transcript_44945:704-1345(+)